MYPAKYLRNNTLLIPNLFLKRYLKLDNRTILHSGEKNPTFLKVLHYEKKTFIVKFKIERYFIEYFFFDLTKMLNFVLFVRIFSWLVH